MVQTLFVVKEMVLDHVLACKIIMVIHILVVGPNAFKIQTATEANLVQIQNASIRVPAHAV